MWPSPTPLYPSTKAPNQLGYVQLPLTRYTNERAPKMAWLELWRVRYPYGVQEGGIYSRRKEEKAANLRARTSVYVLRGQRNIRTGRTSNGMRSARVMRPRFSLDIIEGNGVQGKLGHLSSSTLTASSISGRGE